MNQTEKLQINTEHVTGLHLEVWGDFFGINGDVSGIKGDVSRIFGDPKNMKDGVDISNYKGDVIDITFFPLRPTLQKLKDC